MRNEVEVCKEVERMLKCIDFEFEFLNFVCYEVIVCKIIIVVVVVLSNMLSLYFLDRVMVMEEVVVFRNLILFLI